jgi:hypothetical protein
MSQADTNLAILEALRALHASHEAQGVIHNSLIEAVTTTADLLMQVTDRLELAVALITAHEDNHHA